MSLWGAPSPVYKGVEEGGGPALYGAPWRSPTPTGSRILPPSLVVLGEKEGGRGRKERGAPPPFLVQFGLEGEGARGLPWPPLLFSTKAHVGPLNPRGVPVTPGTPVYIR